ncbi:hypothetical protein [Caballeronia sp. SL2Y3]|uniref:hypothetical protein n=1 Tax=Caballeronia sp. SL2Y3 TaxID=2878151 RepID=UPI001FD32796|nr:hypothetical protein [Caballeronia sp. SL2Y3]
MAWFTVITLSNRKCTLTALGSTLYVVFWTFWVVVIMLSLLSPNAFLHHRP